MTLKEAASQGISKVRLPAWNDRAYLALDLNEDGTHGPWCHLHDPYCTSETLDIVYFQCQDDRYEEYVGQEAEDDNS